MKKVVERNVAEIVFITIITLVMMSSCGVQFGDYERYREVHGKKTCPKEEFKIRQTRVENYPHSKRRLCIIKCHNEN